MAWPDHLLQMPAVGLQPAMFTPSVLRGGGLFPIGVGETADMESMSMLLVGLPSRYRATGRSAIFAAAGDRANR